ncbi:MAG TPA: F0F1 ATP synthase subunit C [Levilinea sp.]|nr:F0F1 ATP synthase subunit C [Levilinea sp.]
MDTIAIVAAASIVAAGFCMGVGALGPALGQGRALSQALASIAQQPDEANTITRTMFVGMAIVESTGIYSLVIAILLIFANPYWNYVIANPGG